MTGAFSWESILEYVSSYNPLDAGVDSACTRFASTGFALSALLSGHSTAKYGYLGYLVLFIQKQGMLGLRTSVIFANFQKGLGALFGLFLVYMAKFRMGLARMILYTYATFISGSQLLWVRPSKRNYRRLFLVAQLSMLGAGYAGERSTSYVYKTQFEKAVKRSQKIRRPRPPPPPSPPPPSPPWQSYRPKPESYEPDNRPPPPSSPPEKCHRPKPGCTCYDQDNWPPPPPPPPHSPPENCYRPKPGCTCHDPDNRLDNRLGGCTEPAATARESCVCSFWGEQYNWRPHVCPILKDGARDGLCTCCYPELSCTEKENNRNSSVIYRVQKMVRNGPNSSVIHRVQKMVRNVPHDTEEEMDSVSIQLQQENARKMRNSIRKKLFAAKLLGAILGTVLAALSSTEVFIKISTAVTMISYNLFFWMGAQCYDLGEMENDTADENESGEMENDTEDENQSGEMENDTAEENQSGETEKQDKNGEEKIDGKQIPVALVPEVKKAVKVVLKLLPLWLTFASTCYLVNATAESLFMEQVDYLESNTEGFKIPTSVFSSFPDVVSHITGQVSYYLVEQFHDGKIEARWARLLRISIGMLFSSLCCIVASLVAYYRLDSDYNSASMLWLLLQFLLSGMMKGILEEGLEEFLHDHLDNELQVQAVRDVAEGVGSFLSMILTAASPSSWVGSDNDISKSNLDNYYRMLAIITLSSTFVFTIVAIACELREKEDTEKSGKKG